VAYSKAAAPTVAIKINTVRGPGRREVELDELETVTPRRKTVQEMSPTLPKKIDRVTTLTGLEVRDDTYKVYYSMDPSVRLDASVGEQTMFVYVPGGSCN
jgi:hypothetical protein